MSTAARPKRAGEEFARTHSPSNKKPRFDHRNPSTLAADARDEEEDLILNADVIGKSGTQTKRNAVNIDGYESDSENDNFDARAAQRERRSKTGGEEGEEEEDDEDMFADLEEKDDGREGGEDGGGGRGKKDVRFLDSTREVEGQVMNSTSGGRVSGEILLGKKGKRRAADDGEDSESSGDEEERDRLDEEIEEDLAAEVGAGGKKKHAPRLDAFNLKAEEEEGRYDESGNYVRKAADPDAVNDNWMDGLTKKDMKRAREAQEKREDERRRKALEDDAVLTSDLLSTLIGSLETGETPLEALQRLNKGKPKETKVPKWKQKKQKDKMDVDEAATNGNVIAANPAEAARKKTVDTITGAADGLYARGQHEIYDAERELLMRQYKRETGEDWHTPAATESVPGADGGSGPSDSWEYRWSDARDGGDVHGPYDAATMKAWSDAGYFGEGVEFRRVGGGEWSRLLDLDL